MLYQQGYQQKELLRQQQAAATGSTHTRRPESLETNISKYKGADEDSLLRCIVDLDDAIRARLIVDDQMRPVFVNRTWQYVQRLGLWASSYMTHMSMGR